MTAVTMFAAAAAAGAPRDAAAQRGGDDEGAIRGVVASYVDAWNRNDMDAWGTLFTDDVDYVNRGGGWWRSNADNVAAHRQIHDGMVRRGARMTLNATVEKLAFLAPDVALVHVRTIASGAVPVANARSGIMTILMVRRGAAWRIRALQNTLVAGDAEGPHR